MKSDKIGLLKILIFLLFTAIILHPNLANSADVNKSLFTGTKKQLLEKYSTMLNNKNNTFAQKTLLLTLINILNSKNTFPEMVAFIGMNNSSIDSNLDVWVSGIDLIYPRRTTSKFLKLIYNALYEHGIEIPFPQMDIHFKNELKVKTGDEN